MIVWFHIWQDDVRDVVGVPHLKWHDYPVAAVLAIVVLFALIEIGQLIRRLILFLILCLNHVVPLGVSAAIAVLAVVAVIVGILNGVVLRLAMRTLNNTFETVNNEESPVAPPPTTMLRSGGPGSLVSWPSLGHQDRIFVDGGPTTSSCRRSTAHRRSNRSVPTPVWGPPMTSGPPPSWPPGDTAIVSMQYSFLPSWLSTLGRRFLKRCRRGFARCRRGRGQSSSFLGKAWDPLAARRRFCRLTTSSRAPTERCSVARPSTMRCGTK